MQRQVNIPKAIFKKSLEDYADWKTAWIREAVQNAVDAGASEVHIDIDQEQGLLRCKDDGRGMKEEILIDVLLSLGGSYKPDNGSIGAFGRAKEILFFAHPEWRVETRQKNTKLTAIGSYINYDLEEDGNSGESGTIVSAFVEDIHSVLNKAEAYLRTCQPLGCKIFLNGTEMTRMHKGSTDEELDWGTIYSNGSGKYPEKLYLRKNGVTMFSKWLWDVEKTVIVELKGDSTETLTTNRDGLKTKYDEELDKLIADLFKEHFEEKTNASTSNDHLDLNFVGFPFSGTLSAGKKPDDYFPDYGFPFVFNCKPDDDFSWDDPKVKQMAKMWFKLGNLFNKMLKERDLATDTEFAFGFTMEEEAQAELIPSSHGMTVVLVNPEFYKSKSLGSLPYRFIHDFFHEFTHLWQNNHDNDFIAGQNYLIDELYKKNGEKRLFSLAGRLPSEVRNEIKHNSVSYDYSEVLDKYPTLLPHLSKELTNFFEKIVQLFDKHSVKEGKVLNSGKVKYRITDEKTIWVNSPKKNAKLYIKQNFPTPSFQFTRQKGHIPREIFRLERKDDFNLWLKEVDKQLE